MILVILLITFIGELTAEFFIDGRITWNVLWSGTLFWGYLFSLPFLWVDRRRG